jgi:RHS repeat-associated protein
MTECLWERGDRELFQIRSTDCFRSMEELGLPLTQGNVPSSARLTQMGASKNAGALSNYAYALGPAGNRTTVAELSGRAVAYGYDALYRLTSETITNDPANRNGTTQYTYDAVGNRRQLFQNGGMVNAYNYDADDRLASDQYDANGNTTNSLGIANAYDFENHLVTHGAVTIVYDGDGNRVSETVGGVTTNYLIDSVNPTGYAQVMDELVSGAVTRTYAYGLERISENQQIASTWTPSFYGYDGHGSVRQLTNAAGVVTDTYDYEAFGNLTNSTGTTPNNYLFAGEQYDPALSLYYNRARYLNTTTGRFWSMDTNEGSQQSPVSLHKYLYASSDPVNRRDPTGHEDIAELTTSFAINNTLNALSVLQLPGGGPDNFISSIFATLIPDSVFSDLLSFTPDAAEVGISIAGTIGRGYGSIGGGGEPSF